MPHNFYATQSGNAQKVGDIWTGNFGSTSLNVNDVLILNPTNANVNLPFAHQVRIRVLEDQSMIDPDLYLVWFGIIVIIVVELGLITPPIGINVFTVKSVIPNIDLTQIFIGVVPFVIADLVVLALIFIVPGLAVLLPSLMF